MEIFSIEDQKLESTFDRRLEEEILYGRPQEAVLNVEGFFEENAVPVTERKL